MTVPVTGALILALGLYLFFFSPRFLYAAVIIAIPFSATAVLNEGSGQTAKGVSAWLFLCTLWMIREALSTQPAWHKSGWFLSRRSRHALLAFLAAVVASLCVPLIQNGTSWIPTATSLSTETVPLQFGFDNITQTVYLGIGILFAILVAATNCTFSELYRTLRFYISSCFAVALWALFQLWCNVTGHAYPAYIFNTNKNLSALGYQQTLGRMALSVTRVSSVALEPSVMAEELLIALVVLFVSVRLKRPILSKKWDITAISLICAALLASTSTTAYAGILIALSLAALSLFRAHKSAKPYFLVAIGAVTAVTLAVVSLPLVREVANAAILHKLQTRSGVGRLGSIRIAASDFLRHPILGAGWHAVASWDLVFLILANTGLIGFVAFTSFLLPVLAGLWKRASKCQATAVIMLPTTALVAILSESSGLTYAAGYVWLVFGLAAGAMTSLGRQTSSARTPTNRTTPSLRRPVGLSAGSLSP